MHMLSPVFDGTRNFGSQHRVAKVLTRRGLWSRSQQVLLILCILHFAACRQPIACNVYTETAELHVCQSASDKPRIICILSAIMRLPSRG